MPINLTKEEVARLNAEQLEAYARVHLDSERTRRELCDQARGSRRSIVFPVAATVLGIVGVVWFPKILLDARTLIAAAVAVLFLFHRRTNRRIDALVRLLKLDRVGDGQTTEGVSHRTD